MTCGASATRSTRLEIRRPQDFALALETVKGRAEALYPGNVSPAAASRATFMPSACLAVAPSQRERKKLSTPIASLSCIRKAAVARGYLFANPGRSTSASCSERWLLGQSLSLAAWLAFSPLELALDRLADEIEAHLAFRKD